MKINPSVTAIEPVQLREEYGLKRKQRSFKRRRKASQENELFVKAARKIQHAFRTHAALQSGYVRENARGMTEALVARGVQRKHVHKRMRLILIYGIFLAVFRMLKCFMLCRGRATWTSC